MTAIRHRSVRTLSLVVILALGASLYPVAAFGVPGATTRVNLGPGGVQANAGALSSDVSADGRFVAFESGATNLVAGDTNGAPDIFVRDRVLGTTERVSIDSAGTLGDAASGSPCISDDGRYVAFQSSATNLVAGDTNAKGDVFIRDRTLGLTARLSVSSASLQANGHSTGVAISADGRCVSFVSEATDLVAGDTNDAVDVFVRDRLLGTTTRASLDSLGSQGNGNCVYTSISGDGRYVAFGSYATLLVSGDTNAAIDIFVRDRVLNTTMRVSVSSSGAQAAAGSESCSISADGRFVAFASNSSDLVAGDSNAASDVFIRDRTANTTSLVSANPLGQPGAGGSGTPAISADGRRVAFTSYAADMVPLDTNATADVLVRDLTLGTTTRASQSSAGVPSDALSWLPAMSADGRCVTFSSFATNLVAGDTNGQFDIFVNQASPAATSITIKTAATSTYIGRTVPLTGAVTPAGMIGVNIVVYVMKPGKSYWTYSSNRTVYKLNGAPAWLYKYYFKRGMARGTYKFKARAPAPGFASSAGFATSESPTVIIKVK